MSQGRNMTAKRRKSSDPAQKSLGNRISGRRVPDKTRDWPFDVSRKTNIRKFSAVAAPGSNLKLPNIVFFEIHPKSVAASFVRDVAGTSDARNREKCGKNMKRRLAICRRACMVRGVPSMAEIHIQAESNGDHPEKCGE